MNKLFFCAIFSLPLCTPLTALAADDGNSVSASSDKGASEKNTDAIDVTSSASRSEEEDRGASDEIAASSSEEQKTQSPEEASTEEAGTGEGGTEATDAEELARRAFREGDRKYLEGDYQGAVHAFEEAYAQSGRIEMLFNLANAHERLGNYAEAATALRGYIPHAPTQNRQALTRRLERLEQQAAEAKQAQKTEVPAPTPPAPKQAEPAKSPVSAERGVGIGLLTLGSAGIVTGTAFALSALNTRSQLGDVCQDGSSGRLCPPQAETLLSRDKTNSLVADVALIGGTLLTITGIYLVVYSGKSSQVTAQVRPNGLHLGGTF